MRELTRVVEQALEADERAVVGLLDLDALLDDAETRVSRRRRRRHVVEIVSVAAVAVTVLVVAVGAGAGTTPAPVPPAQTAAPSPMPSLPPGQRIDDGEGRPLPVTSVDLTAATAADAGTDYAAHDVTPHAAGVVPLMLLRDGSWFATKVPQGASADGLAGPSRVGTWDGTQFRPWSSTADLVPDDGPRQVWGQTASDDWVVWSESESTQAGIGAWRMFAATPSGGDVHLVAQSGTEGLPLDSDGDAAMAVLGDRVYWGVDTSTSTKDAPDSLELLSRDVSGQGEIRIEGIGMQDPVVVAGDIVVKSYTLGDGGAGTAAAFGLVRLTENGRVPFLRVPSDQGALTRQSIRDVSADGDRLAFTLGNDLYVYDVTSSGLTRLVTPTGAGAVGAPASGDGFVAWTVEPRGGPSVLYRFDGSDVARVDLDRERASVYAAGHELGWSVGNGDATLTQARWTD